MLIDLLLFLLQRDDHVPPHCTLDGQLTWNSSPPPEDGSSPAKTRKVVVYQEFSSMAEMLVRVGHFTHYTMLTPHYASSGAWTPWYWSIGC